MQACARPLIVLAEDNKELRELLAGSLEAVGYRVVQEATGDQLVATVRRLLDDHEPLQLIITDVRMPMLGGVAAARMLRDEGRATPMILMTAYGDVWTRTEAANLGALLLDKPLGIKTLRRAVADVIGSGAER